MIKRARSSGGSRAGISLRSGSRFAACVAAVGFAVAACQSSPSATPGAQLVIENVDGPASSVSIGGAAVATVACGKTVTVAPSQAQPWDVVVTNASGSVTLHQTLTTAPLSYVLIRSDGVLAGAGYSPGGPAPGTTCPPG